MQVKIDLETIRVAAANRGYTPEEYISRLASICNGRKVCAHFTKNDKSGKNAIFSLA